MSSQFRVNYIQVLVVKEEIKLADRRSDFFPNSF